MKKRYAIKVMLSADDWIYITEDNGGNCWDLVPLLFKTKKEAMEHAKIWSSRHTKVVEYDDL